MGQRLQPVENVVDVDLGREKIDKGTPNCATAEADEPRLNKYT